MIRFVPPAGAPLGALQILSALKMTCFGSSHADKPMDLFARRLQVRHAFALSSGRSALWAILKGLHRLRPEKSVVAVPAYICFSVPASIVRAGLRIEPVDINIQTLDFDYSKLEALPEEDLLCIVASSPFGLIGDFSRVAAVARAKKAFVIDNAAQALGASRNGQYAGTRGDAGLYSLGRGKAATVLEGGIVVTNCQAIADAVANVVTSLPKPSVWHEVSILLQMLIYAAFLHPRLYWLPNSLPWLNLGVTEFAPAFRTEHLSKLSENLLEGVLATLEGMNKIRYDNAAYLKSGMNVTSRLKAPEPAAGADSVYIRLPLVAPDPQTQQQLVHQLRKAGIGAAPFYPSAICDIEGIGQHMARRDFHCPNAEELSRRLFTVPTHPYVQRGDLRTMVNILNQAVGA